MPMAKSPKVKKTVQALSNSLDEATREKTITKLYLYDRVLSRDETYLSRDRLSSFCSTDVRRYDKISTFYTSFDQLKDNRPVEMSKLRCHRLNEVYKVKISSYARTLVLRKVLT